MLQYGYRKSAIAWGITAIISDIIYFNKHMAQQMMLPTKAIIWNFLEKVSAINFCSRKALKSSKPREGFIEIKPILVDLFKDYW